MMEQNKEVLELLKEIEKNSRRQARTGKLLCLLVVAMVVCSGVLCGAVLMLLPQVETVIVQMQGVLGNLEEATGQLASVDFSGMISDVDALVTAAQSSLDQTMNKLDTIDFNTLNKAIGDLAKVVEPMSRLMNVFQ